MNEPRYLQVLVEVPIDDAKSYIITELACAGGCRRSEDPLFEGLKVASIRSVKA